MQNMKAALIAAGASVSSFSSTTDTAVWTRNVVIVALEIEKSTGFYTALSSSVVFAIRAFVRGGGVYIFAGPSRYTSFMNSVFNFSLSSCSMSSNSTKTAAAPVWFEGTPSSLPVYLPGRGSSVSGLDTASLPAGATTVYDAWSGISGAWCSTVTVMHYGSGMVIVLAPNWYQSSVGWNEVLVAATRVAPLPPAPPSPPPFAPGGYALITSGTCGSAGLYPVVSPAACESAANGLGLAPRTTRTGWEPAVPSFCWWWGSYATDGTKYIFLNSNDLSTANCSIVYQCLCSATAPPPPPRVQRSTPLSPVLVYVIVLSSVFGSIALIALGVGVWCWLSSRKRQAKLREIGVELQEDGNATEKASDDQCSGAWDGGGGDSGAGDSGGGGGSPEASAATTEIKHPSRKERAKKANNAARRKASILGGFQVGGARPKVQPIDSSSVDASAAALPESQGKGGLSLGAVTRMLWVTM